MSKIANTPNPPYYAVIFSSIKTSSDKTYDATAEKMLYLASQQVGFLGVESARSDVGITVSYWSSIEAIKAWKANLNHQHAQRLGRDIWYDQYKVRIAKVEREYGF
jgi:heme-degrading monooxygenase HmoA